MSAPGPGGVGARALGLEPLLAPPLVDEAPSVEAFVEAEWERGRGASPFARAVSGGARAGTLERAFSIGYVSAVAALAPDERLGALALTEAAGPRPNDLATTLRRVGPGELELEGVKTFVTLGALVELVYVVAREARGGAEVPGPGARLRVVRLSRGAPGARLEPRPPLPFAPGVAHARLVLEGVRVDDDDVLPGDGWARYGRPFRSIEDVHVLAALVAHALAHAARSAHEERELALVVLLALEGIADRLASDLASAAEPEPERSLVAPATELALAGALGLAERALDALGARLEGPVRAAFERDAPLLGVARAAREQRRARAWQRVDG